MSDYTTFIPGSVAATNSAAQELRFGSLAYYQSALDQFCQNLETSFKFAKQICDAMEEAAKHEKEAAEMQAWGTIASGVSGVIGGAVSLGYQNRLSNELKTAGTGQVAVSGTPVAGAGGANPSAATSPPNNLPTPRSVKEIEADLQNMPNLINHLSKSLGELAQGTGSMLSAEERYKAAMESKDQKWFENCQQTLSRFLDLLKEQRQLTTQLMDDAKRAHELIIQAATSRG